MEPTEIDAADVPFTVEKVEGGWLISHRQFSVTLAFDALRESALRLEAAVTVAATLQSSDSR